MFRNLRLPCVIAAFTLALVTSSTNAEVFHSKLQGPSIGVSFSDYDPVKCVYTLAAFSINEMQFSDTSGTPSSSPWISLYIDQYSPCGYPGGAEYFAYEAIPAGAFHTDGGRMSTATLQITIYAAYERGQPKIVPVTIDVVLTGEGEVTTGHSSQTTSNRFFRTVTRSHGTARAATVSGSMLLWGENLADTESFAILGFSHSGSITVQKPR
ncbi:MAG TPA: hypothetical protein VNM67_19530 [Thermoanaerobaculia bacterium]|jgi:hypothetical protein|nr:hypothetical protein [Thermoanaerobaculia bacterium]